jgi:hypothetical protein
MNLPALKAGYPVGVASFYEVHSARKLLTVGVYYPHCE